jgi:hypothetical protein
MVEPAWGVTIGIAKRKRGKRLSRDVARKEARYKEEVSGGSLGDDLKLKDPAAGAGSTWSSVSRGVLLR